MPAVMQIGTALISLPTFDAMAAQSSVDHRLPALQGEQWRQTAPRTSHDDGSIGAVMSKPYRTGVSHR
jgi:hypothetical protein